MIPPDTPPDALFISFATKVYAAWMRVVDDAKAYGLCSIAVKLPLVESLFTESSTRGFDFNDEELRLRRMLQSSRVDQDLVKEALKKLAQAEGYKVRQSPDSYYSLELRWTADSGADASIGEVLD